jgi:hypothetical protein
LNRRRTAATGTVMTVVPINEAWLRTTGYWAGKRRCRNRWGGLQQRCGHLSLGCSACRARHGQPADRACIRSPDTRQSDQQTQRQGVADHRVCSSEFQRCATSVPSNKA